MKTGNARLWALLGNGRWLDRTAYKDSCDSPSATDRPRYRRRFRRVRKQNDRRLFAADAA